MSEIIDLDSLVGKHVLSGVDHVGTRVEPWEGCGYFEDADGLMFVLDGRTLIATEDPSDGYRSCLKDLRVTDATVKNQFPPCEVLAVKRGRDLYQDHDVIDFYDTTTGKLVLSVGTGNHDDYYPFYVGTFDPTGLSINQTGE
jgi:hypothetical protein